MHIVIQSFEDNLHIRLADIRKNWRISIHNSVELPTIKYLKRRLLWSRKLRLKGWNPLRKILHLLRNKNIYNIFFSLAKNSNTRSFKYYCYMGRISTLEQFSYDFCSRLYHSRTINIIIWRFGFFYFIIQWGKKFLEIWRI